MKQYPTFSQNRCSISDDWIYKGMRVVWMENDWLKIGILVDRGSDIFEFRYKPKQVDFLLRMPGRLRNLQTDVTQMRDTANQFEDHYYGGWQEILPNSPTFVYRGASLGQHGEISMIPWKYAIVKDTDEEVSLKVWTRPVRVPVLIEKTLTLKAGEATLHIEETLTNESHTHLDLMWGHHIAFGLPFIQEGVEIKTPAKTMLAEAQMPDHRRFRPDKQTEWPEAIALDGQRVDASKVPPEGTDPYSELAYLSGFEENAWYTIKNAVQDVGFALSWNASVFEYLWFWQERYATQDFPWWGKCYTVALEPWTSAWTSEPEAAIENGDWLRLEARSSIQTRLSASAFEGKFMK